MQTTLTNTALIQRVQTLLDTTRTEYFALAQEGKKHDSNMVSARYGELRNMLNSLRNYEPGAESMVTARLDFFENSSRIPNTIICRVAICKTCYGWIRKSLLPDADINADDRTAFAAYKRRGHLVEDIEMQCQPQRSCSCK